MKRVHLIISGDVQGVGFRAWVLGQAQDLKVTGWVKNREDGAVEIVAEGDRNNLVEFAKRCRNGTELARVKKVETEWHEVRNEFLQFEVTV